MQQEEPKNGHAPIPVWRSLDGKQYCYQYEVHGAWVAWPCEKARGK